VFSEDAEPGWVLKSGTSMLARVASSPATTDVDLFGQDRTLDAALEDLRRLASIDLADFFRFSYIGHTNAVAGDQQAHVEGYRVSFDVYIGAKKKGRLHVDLVVSVAMIGKVDVVAPANALDLPKLASHLYRLYPVVDQIADKVCATLALYRGRASSREKDLVDLVVLAVTQEADGTKLTHALEAEVRARSLSLPTTFHVPPTWGRQYRKLASAVPACADYPTVEAAVGFVRAPSWILRSPAWRQERPGARPGSPGPKPRGTAQLCDRAELQLWQHTRSGRLVRVAAGDRRARP
jgi:hypothetical protein